MVKINPTRAEFILENVKIYLYMYFLSFVNIEVAQAVEILPCGRQWLSYLTYILIIMVNDDLATQGARASAAMILTQKVLLVT